MVGFYEKLFDLLDEGRRLVLPTEQAARSLLCEYVKARGKAISFSSVIAFDTFREILFRRDPALKASDGLVRLLFAKDFIDSYSERPTYFIPNDRYPEIKERMVYYIASALVSLEDDECYGREVEKDVAFLRRKYLDFLSSSGYYEPSFISGLENKLTEPYTLVFSSSSVQMAAFYSRLKDKRNIELVDVDDGRMEKLFCYENEKQEIRNTFLAIKELIKNGATLDSIAISSAGYERLRPYFERESYLLDIPLSFMYGSSALSYPAGTIFSIINEIYTSSYDIESLKKLLLNSSFPLRNEDDARRFILNAIEKGITSNSGEKDRYPEADTGRIYHDLRHYVDSINETGDPDYLINQVKSLFQKLLRDEQFGENSEDERVLSYLMDTLMHFSEKIKEFKKLGLLTRTERLYPLFLKYAESTIYVPKEKDGGVRVYPLSEAVGIYFPYHFVMTLNEDEARKIRKGSSYLSDYELTRERSEIDITRNMILSYSALSEDVVFSTSESTYNGYALALTEFEEKAEPVFLKDSINDEHQLLKKHSLDYDLYPIQQKSHRAAELRALRVKSDSSDLAGSLHLKWPDFKKDEWTFSASQIDKYLRCPFLYAVDNVFHLSKERSYVVDTYPAMEIGSRLHKVIELYFKNGGGCEEEKVEEYLCLVLDLWQERMTLDRDLGRAPLGKDVIALSPQMRKFIEFRYQDSLVSLIKELNKRGERFSLEERLKGVIGGMNFSAFLDCVLERGDSVEIYDFKTSRVNPDSLQFEIYRLLYENVTGRHVESASYAIIKDGKIRRPVVFREDEEVMEILGSSADGIGLGDFHGVNSAKSCQGCLAKGICRRRFFVR